MAGLIDEEDLQTVRERSRIEDVVGAFVTLRPAGGGSLVGLCPFHDEKTPSFRVTPARGFYHCFGCGEGGDVIRFVEKIQNVSFVEAVEFLADRAGVQLRYTQPDGQRQEPGRRLRILEANRLAAEFYSAQLASPEAITGRRFLDGRGFDQAAAEHFGIGYAPQDGHVLGRHLRTQGFKDEELVAAGLIRHTGWDFFQGRLLWPIRDAGRSVLGFGGRRLFDDDRMPAKYLNTPETPVYKKSQVLYGLDLARPNIAKKHQAVIVEGYTDVMAAHLAGVDTAVASCGTAFGDEHGKLVQRLIGADSRSGEVIFTFDGDAAGRAAALKVFSGDEHFSAQTYAAVDPNGLDPCDLRIQQGDAALRELIGRRIPLYEFVMQNVLSEFDLDRVDGRLAALRAAAPLAASARDASLVEGYVRELAQLLGMDVAEVRREVHAATKRGRARPSRAPGRGEPGPAQTAPQSPADQGETAPKRPTLPVPNPRDPRLEPERSTLRLAIRAPEAFGPAWGGLSVDDFTHPAYRALFERICAADTTSPDWAYQLADDDTDPVVAELVVELAVEPILRQPTPDYVSEYVTTLRLLALGRDIDALKSKLQRTNPVEHPAEHQEMFRRLADLESQRVALRAKA